MYVVTVFLCLAQKINLFTMYHNGDTNDDDYIDTDDNGMTPLQAVLTALTDILPTLIMILVLLLEFLVNFYFGNWIARLCNIRTGGLRDGWCPSYSNLHNYSGACNPGGHDVTSGICVWPGRGYVP